MTAKEYLSQLKLLDLKINHRIRQRDELKEIMYSIPAVNTENERVSGGVKRNYNKVDKYADMEKEIDKMIDEFVFIKHKIIGEIHQLTRPLFVDVLYKKYVEFKRLEIVAVELDKSYQYIVEVHGYALKEFSNRFNTLLKTYDYM